MKIGKRNEGGGAREMDYNKDNPASMTNPIIVFIPLSKIAPASDTTATPGTLEEEEQLVIVLVSWVTCDLVMVVEVILEETGDKVTLVEVDLIAEDSLWEIVVVTRGVEVVKTVETADTVTSGVVVIST